MLSIALREGRLHRVVFQDCSETKGRHFVLPGRIQMLMNTTFYFKTQSNYMDFHMVEVPPPEHPVPLANAFAFGTAVNYNHVAQVEAVLALSAVAPMKKLRQRTRDAFHHLITEGKDPDANLPPGVLHHRNHAEEECSQCRTFRQRLWDAAGN